MENNEKDAKDCVEEDVVEVVMETKSMLATFDKFYDRGVILYFTSKLPLVSWIKQWLNSFMRMYMWVQEVSMMWFFDCQNIVRL